MGLFAVGLLACLGNACEVKLTDVKSQSTLQKKAYTQHVPIHISGNSQFNGSNGVRSGTGKQYDPYIISGWDINASANIGIYIEDTNASFIIQDCYIHHGGTNYNAINLMGVRNGVIEQNELAWDWAGVFMDHANTNTIVNNNIHHNNYVGIRGLLSQTDIIQYNNITYNHDGGIYFLSCGGNILSYNDFRLNVFWGVWISSSIAANRMHHNLFWFNCGSTEIYNASNIQVHDDSANDYWCLGTEGNYWSDWNSPDNDHDGKVDLPYMISSTLDIKDPYPLVIVFVPEYSFVPGVIIVAFIAVTTYVTLRPYSRGNERK
jgi:parallel beta-helix repeat protein